MAKKVPHEKYSPEYCRTLLRAAAVNCRKVYHVDLLLGEPYRIFFVDFKSQAKHVLIRLDNHDVQVIETKEGWPA